MTSPVRGRIDAPPPPGWGMFGSPEEFQKLISGHATADLSRGKIEMGDPDGASSPEASPVADHTEKALMPRKFGTKSTKLRRRKYALLKRRHLRRELRV